MNKFLAIIIIALILSLMGCSEPPDPVIPVDSTPGISDLVSDENKNDIKSDIKQPEKTVQNTPEPALEENQGNQENQGNIEPPPEETTQVVPDLTSVSTQINTELFSILGMNKAEAIQRFGEIEKTEWLSGEIFKHENCDFWFGYSNIVGDYDFYEVADDAVITTIICTVSDVFLDQDVSEKNFDESLRRPHDEISYGAQLLEYDDINISIHYNGDNTIGKTSLAWIWTNED